MNRYSLVFALLVASSFAVHSPETTEPASSAGAASNQEANRARGVVRHFSPQLDPADPNGPIQFVRNYLDNAAPWDGSKSAPQILFVTVPHPLETHLAPAFDHNLDALQDGLAESKYLFDSSWIPWSSHDPREKFDDDEKEKVARSKEDDYPGILLFRSNKPGENPYLGGIVAFLISEKPTQGLAIREVQTACAILQKLDLHLSYPLRILGPNYSGSFVSLVSMLQVINDSKLLPDPKSAPKSGNNSRSLVLIRSGGVTVGDAAQQAAKAIAAISNDWMVDFGSAQYDGQAWTLSVYRALSAMGIDMTDVATLSEEESLYGVHAMQPQKPLPATEPKWRLAFPRDISSLRAGYESQGIFDSISPTQPWKRQLNLKTVEQGQGDTIKSFGGSSTTTIQEGILFGTSDFLRTHAVRVVIIAATNPEDSYFLAQFLHAHNSSVRIVVLGASRTFTRASTAQFRGDMIVDDFPMLPKLPDWTGQAAGGAARLFADDVAEGIYFSALDLFLTQDFSEPPGSLSAQLPSSYEFAEYTEPALDPARWAHEPPMYVVAMGIHSNWPVGMYPLCSFPSYPFLPAGECRCPQELNQARQPSSDKGNWTAAMPFGLLSRVKNDNLAPAATATPMFPAGRLWKCMFAALIFSVAAYCACFWIANPILRIHCAGHQPTSGWRFWLLTVTVPSAVALGGFQILAWSSHAAKSIAPGVFHAWQAAEITSVIASMAVACSALLKARLVVKIPWNGWMVGSLSPCAIALANCLSARPWRDPISAQALSEVLNTFREMHFESGLSLVPTLLILLAAFFVWASQAGTGAALLEVTPPIICYPGVPRISRTRAVQLVHLGKPLPSLAEGKWIWIPWLVLLSVALYFHFSRPFLAITSLESYATTRMVLTTTIVVVALIVLDLVQFVHLWSELRAFLRALQRQHFKRSFVPINDFKWPNLWGFSGISFRDRSGIDAAMSECVLNLACKFERPGFAFPAAKLQALRKKYCQFPTPAISAVEFARDRRRFFGCMSVAATRAAVQIEEQRYARGPAALSTDAAAPQRASESTQKGSDAFAAEREEVSRLPEWQQTAERLICLMYVGFVQSMIARLHSLLIAIASMFSLLVIAVAIYPFVPFGPLFIAGVAWLGVIAWAFYKVFSELDRDPILSRIVDGDDRKLQLHFYSKFAEALALPLLALATSVLPGGAGRILELAESVLNHAQ